MVASNSVLLLTPFFRPNIGGVETRLDELTKALSRRNISVHVLTFQPLITKDVTGLAYENPESATIHIYRKRWFGGDLFHKLLNYPALELLYLGIPLFFYASIFLLKYKSKYNIKTIHAAGLNATFVGVLLKKLFRVRLISSTHALYTFDKSLFTTITRIVMNQTDGVLAIGEASKEELTRAGVQSEKIVVQPTWVNQDVFKPMDKALCKAKLGLSARCVFGYIGRLNEIKGVRLLLDFASQLKPESNCIVVFVGTGDLEEEIILAAAQNQHIKFFGKVTNYEAAEYYNALDVFCLLALYPEGYSRSTVEALSCGTPVIATTQGCLPEIVNNQVGWLVAANAQEIIDTLNIIAANTNEIQDKGRKSAVYARDKYNENNVEKIIKLYNL